MIPFAPFYHEKKEDKKQEPLPLYAEEVPYIKPQKDEDQEDYDRVIIIDIL